MGQAELNSTGEPLSGPCPLCGHTEYGDWRFGLLRCRKCEFIVAESVWRMAANEQLNEGSFGDAYEPVRSFWVRMFEAWNNRRTMSRLPGAGGELLEIGVGSGSFLAYARARGYSPMGCDLSSAVCGKVERSTGIRIHCGHVGTLPEGQLFDVVVMNHVLEHVCDPVEFLKSVRSHLKPNGTLHLAVPNAGSWGACLPGWISYEPYHLLYFTPETVRLAVEKAGFEISRLATHESFSGWFLAVLHTMLGKSLSTRTTRDQVSVPGHSTRIVEHFYRLFMVAAGLVSLPLRRLQEYLERGDELILLAENPANV